MKAVDRRTFLERVAVATGGAALWPFADGHYKSPWPIFMDIGRTLEWITVRRNTVAVAWEAALLSPLLVLAWRFRTRPRR